MKENKRMIGEISHLVAKSDETNVFLKNYNPYCCEITIKRREKVG